MTQPLDPKALVTLEELTLSNMWEVAALIESKNMNKRLLTYFYIVVGFGLLVATPTWADFQAGLAAYDRGEFETALKEWRPLAEQGNVSFQFLLGTMYADGQGVPQDDQEAVKWFRRAAEQGHASAQFNLGLSYNLGEGVTQDYQEGVKWYRLAAEQGYANAQHNLGVIYSNGRGVPQDDVLAHMWVNLAASKGIEVMVKTRDAIATKMTPQQIAEAQRLAREWKAKGE